MNCSRRQSGRPHVNHPRTPAAPAKVSPLDRPVWHSLSSYLEPLGIGGPLARRFRRDVNLFASARDDSPEALAALADLMQPDEHVYVLQVPQIVVPAGCVALKEALGVQLVAARSLEDAGPFDDVHALGEADASEMLALARLTEPGPFLERTHTMGRFVGIRIGGRLAAMAGERMHVPGYTEVSGVCTHPDFRGRGLARRLSAAVAVGIEARGERPFLHAWSSNRAAIALYESLGFVFRVEVNVAVLERERGRV